MRTGESRRLRLAWLVPDDFGGGVISVAQACCRQAALAGHDARLLLALTSNGHATEFGGVRLSSLDSLPPHADLPSRVVRWLDDNPQDVLLLNGCEEADVAIPYLPQATRVIYVVHDTAERYFRAALRHEDRLDAILAVSQTVADRFRHRLRNQTKLRVVLNGTVFPVPADAAHVPERENDLVFLGGDKPIKGAFDAVTLWGALAHTRFEGRLHWFGEVDDALRRAVAAAPECDRIVLHGRQPRLAIFEAARRSKVLLMLSRVEPFGMATIECMGMGCLPVAWDIPTGTKEIVARGEGAFAPLGDFAALANSVIQVLDCHASTFASAARRIRERFSEEAMWSRYESVLAEICVAARAARRKAGRRPPRYRRPFRLYQLVPASIRSTIRIFVGRRPRLGYLLRDLRGR